MFSPNILIGLGASLMALGGFVATNGWNAKSTEGDRTNRIRAVAAETIVNIGIINSTKFVEPDDAKRAKLVPYPRIQMIALEGAIASGLFLRESDRLLLTRMTDLRENVHQFNDRLTFSESQMAANKSAILKCRTQIRDGSVRSRTLMKLGLLVELLIENYGITKHDQFFVKLDEDPA